MVGDDEAASLSRDVVFLGTADEEVGFAGAERAFSAEGWGERLKRAEYVIAEGGENVTSPTGEPEYFAVETAQGILLSPYDPTVEKALALAAKTAKRYRNALRQLSK